MLFSSRVLLGYDDLGLCYNVTHFVVPIVPYKTRGFSALLSTTYLYCNLNQQMHTTVLYLQ